ncbi:MAG: response regulator [Methanothrix sp.]|nr:response regulator [Methanothrix sp.]
MTKVIFNECVGFTNGIQFACMFIVSTKHFPKILVVDDDKLICWALRKEFASLNMATRVVETAAEAIAELRKESYDLVFLDIHLPDGNGFELLEECGRISPATPIIIMSGDSSGTNREKALTGGALQFIEKPLDLSEIHSILQSALGAQSNQRKHPRHICRVPLRISILEPAPDEAQYDLHNLGGMMAEFGSGGFRLRTEYPLRVGQHVRARTDAENDPFRKFAPSGSHAEVVWVNPTQDGVVAGLQFVN